MIFENQNDSFKKIKTTENGSVLMKKMEDKKDEKMKKKVTEKSKERRVRG